ncbi:nuclear transport factor 2 family protein [Micromonospora chokoriensis]|uniref:nuclear transport factor 2 family protein n=1 Tax=Micromonospora chokoriensis TaxID=356851 RepID=UPI0004C2F74D|nr:nuclear transport factor 2 family protein [Micromonospora chokoriensis]
MSDELLTTITDLYRSLGDRPAFDAYLHPDLTFWESDAAGLLTGLRALDDLRDRRATRAAGSPPLSVVPEDLRADAWGDTGLVRYLLRARFGDTRPDECFRVTDVLRREDGSWRIVHHHAEAVR